MALRQYHIPPVAMAPEARPLAGSDVSIIASSERDTIKLHMTRAHAQALHESLTRALAVLQIVNPEPKED